MPVTQMKISAEEHRQRCEKLLMHLHAEGLNGVVLFDRQYVLYYTGFAFIPTERPMAFVMNKRGERGMFVPRLELEHAQANALIDRVDHYLEYPYTAHPMIAFQKMLDEMGMQGPVGADEDGYPWVFGYRGPKLSEMLNAPVRSVRAFVEDAMMIKSPAEIRLIREACVWANLGHVLLQRYTKVGATETEVSQRAGDEATRAMYDAIGPIYRGQSEYYGGVVAGYRGQIGRNAAIPHALANARSTSVVAARRWIAANDASPRLATSSVTHHGFHSSAAVGSRCGRCTASVRSTAIASITSAARRVGTWAKRWPSHSSAEASANHAVEVAFAGSAWNRPSVSSNAARAKQPSRVRWSSPRRRTVARPSATYSAAPPNCAIASRPGAAACSRKIAVASVQPRLASTSAKRSTGTGVRCCQWCTNGNSANTRWNARSHSSVASGCGWA